MGSRIMHLIIANRIAEKMSIEDRSQFLLGSIAPDAVSPKELSHFFTGDVRDYSRGIDYKGFLYKYHSQEACHYILGYFTHLIADDIWLRGFYLGWHKDRMEAEEDLYRIYHNDFRLLNGKLLEHYGYTDELRKILSGHFPTILDLQEVKSEEVKAFIPHVLGDMEYDMNLLVEPLNVFMFSQILGYIETSVDLGVMNVKPILATNLA